MNASTPKRLRVDLLPQPGLAYPDVVLVVDVIRATTTAAAFLEAGASAIYVSAGLEQARAFKDHDVVIAGEEGGLTPAGFDYGNSPREALEAPVTGKTVVMATTNGTRAAHLAAATAKHVLLASLYNAHAAARLANDLATEEVAILCAGAGGRVGLDDTYTAGVLAEFIQLMGSYDLQDGTLIALATRRTYPDPLEPLSLSLAAKSLQRVGLEADVPFCARIAASPAVPVLEGRVGEALIFRRYQPQRAGAASSEG
ncbi:putative 2-phosphosulfolactate phosphatase [Calidithermus terrae]|uniref:Probable 2-phosphosulfolactate phosphatase n=1 Tax=Calidithermus terrae TaxID=1408545 RepID=A0A399E8H4_9DEIN|nr:2-phosphosulfolactate phosphatase [Calidithermus terrae]RIH79803.1 putative 2-phosphosulfolactate phosphatase [Calidithermus terrae]